VRRGRWVSNGTGQNAITVTTTDYCRIKNPAIAYLFAKEIVNSILRLYSRNSMSNAKLLLDVTFQEGRKLHSSSFSLDFCLSTASIVLKELKTCQHISCSLGAMSSVRIP